MREADDFGKPDRVGFEALMREPLIYYQGMIFRKGAFNQTHVDSLLVGKSLKEVQKELNHTHMFLYAADIEIQRRWSHELQEHWRERFENEFTGMKVEFSEEDNGQEVIITFWTSAENIHQS